MQLNKIRLAHFQKEKLDASKANAQLFLIQISDTLRSELGKLKVGISSTKEKVRLTRKETAAKLRCDISTLWRKRKKLVPRRTDDGNVYYLADEVEAYESKNDQL